MALHDPWNSYRNQRDDIEPADDADELEQPTLAESVAGSIIMAIIALAIFGILGKISIEIVLGLIALGVIGFLLNYFKFKIW